MDYIVIIALVILGLAILSIESNISSLRKEVKNINKTLEKIAKEIGAEDKIPENLDDDLKKLIAEGKKIQAIKQYIKATGVSLKEGKQYIDNLTNDYNKYE